MIVSRRRCAYLKTTATKAKAADSLAKISG
jgi:hypothetical protein